jgi:hypothetical protein
MKALSDKQQAVAQEQLLKLLCFNCLPMLLALILLGWLSFGLPHPTWFLLLKTIIQANILMEQQGMSFLLPLFILAIQSIFLICAWGLLIWGITREVKTVMVFYSDIAMLQTASPSVATPATPVVPQPAVAPPPPVAPYASPYPPAQPYASAAPLPPPASPLNPFESDDENDFPTEIIDLPTQLITPPDYGTPATSLPISTTRYASYDLLTGATRRKEESGALPIEEPVYDEQDVAEPPRKRSTSIQRRAPISSSPELDQDDDLAWKRPAEEEIPPYTPPSAPAEDPLEATMISARSKMNKASQAEGSKQAQPALPAPKPRPKQQPTPPPDDPFSVIEDDPFAVKEDVLHVFEQEEPEEHTPEPDDPVFVYGNPFEGPLPDVFMHDEDLKRSIEEQNIALSDDATSQAATKKAGQKQTGIRKRS